MLRILCCAILAGGFLLTGPQIQTSEAGRWNRVWNNGAYRGMNNYRYRSRLHYPNRGSIYRFNNYRYNSYRHNPYRNNFNGFNRRGQRTGFYHRF